MSILRRTNDWGPFEQLGQAEERPERIVWNFMISYQAEHQMPPTLDEISEVLPHKYRSSAKHYVEILLKEWWAEEVAEEGKSRRYRAVNVPVAPEPGDREYITKIIPRGIML